MSSKNSAGRQRRYHHGALREALLQAAESVLLERGIEGFTLRECARRAGVSHAAPAHHFGDSRGLLTALAASAFSALASLMQLHRSQAESDAAAQLLAVGQAYVAFALKHRVQFLLMFRSDRLEWNSPQLTSEAAAAFGHLVATLRGVLPADDPAFEAKLAMTWSVVHGFAALVIDNARFRDIAGAGARLRQTLDGVLNRQLKALL
jgi:AcrR family transcriptional regulator